MEAMREEGALKSGKLEKYYKWWDKVKKSGAKAHQFRKPHYRYARIDYLIKSALVQLLPNAGKLGDKIMRHNLAEKWLE